MWRFLLLLVCAMTSTLGSVRGTTNESDVSALNSWYAAIGSPAQLNGWSANGGDPCDESWTGITCQKSSVVQIFLPNAGLNGSLLMLGSLKSLVSLDLSNNNFSGDIDYNLPSNCEQINLSGNKFTGRVPFSVSRMFFLKYLHLAHNQLQLPLDDMFGSLPNLVTLDLSFNNLPGNLPYTFASLISLKILLLQYNQFTGSIDVLANLPLETLDVSYNHFTGRIPAQLTNIFIIDTDGNSWDTAPAPSPSTPPPSGSRNPNSDHNDNPNGGDKKSGVSGAGIAGILITLLVIHVCAPQS